MSPTHDCGRSIEALSDYLDTGTSADAEHIAHCPQCQARLAGLRGLHAAALDLMADDLARDAAQDAGWMDAMMTNLQLETRSGRSIPLAGAEHERLSATEGSVIALVRHVGDTFHHALIGRCTLDGEVTVPGAAVDININVSALYGHPLPELAQGLREAVFAALTEQTELNITAVNVAITDILLPPEGGSRTPLGRPA